MILGVSVSVSDTRIPVSFVSRVLVSGDLVNLERYMKTLFASLRGLNPSQIILIEIVNYFHNSNNICLVSGTN